MLVRKLLLFQPCYFYCRTKLLTQMGERIFGELITVEIHVQKCSVGFESHDRVDHTRTRGRLIDGDNEKMKGLNFKLNVVQIELIDPREEDSAKV